jgi:peptide-methionine (S)-S-oxide reductase
MEAKNNLPTGSFLGKLETKTAIAVFGGGCFWCTEAIFQNLRGVMGVRPGYAGGDKPHPSYEEVSSGQTGHAEVTRIEFDPTAISYDDLLTVFFATHDPTSLNRQGNDVGTQYRSIVLYVDEAQKIAAENYIKKLNEESKGGKPLVTEVKPLVAFYEAEDYHRNYYLNHQDESYCQFVIAPKLGHLRERFRELLKDGSK